MFCLVSFSRCPKNKHSVADTYSTRQLFLFKKTYDIDIENNNISIVHRVKRRKSIMHNCCEYK